MSTRRVIAFEGLPFTGKSTAAANLLRGSSGVVAVVPDYQELVAPHDRRRMATLSDSATDQRVRVGVYRSLDDERWNLARELIQPVVVFDRCFVSIAAYRLALQRTFGASRWSRSLDPETADTRCERPVPLEILYFDVDVDVAVDRHRWLSVTIDPLLRTPAFSYTYNPAGGCTNGALKSHCFSAIHSVPAIAVPCRRPSSRLFLSLLARLTAPLAALPRSHASTELPSQA